jgi:hypothetical protein
MSYRNPTKGDLEKNRRNNMAKNKPYIWCILLITAVCLPASSCAKRPATDKTAVKVNDYSITAAEFNELFSEAKDQADTPEARKRFLDNLIMRKLLLQEAQGEGLDKQKDFLKAIENFWEQSLLKIVVDKKIQEVSRNITVTDKELEDYYNKWVQEHPGATKTFDEIRRSIKLPLLRKKQTMAVNTWVEDLKKKASIAIDKKAIGIE